MYCSSEYQSGDYTTNEDNDDDDEDDDDDEIDWGFNEAGPGPGPGRGQGSQGSTPSAANHSPSASGPTTQPTSRSNTQANNSHPRSTNSSLASLTASVSSHQPINRSRSLTHPFTRPTTNSRDYASYINRETGFRRFAGIRNRNRTNTEMLEEAVRNNMAARQELTESLSSGFSRRQRTSSTPLRERCANAALRRNRVIEGIGDEDEDRGSENRRAPKRQRTNGGGTMRSTIFFLDCLGQRMLLGSVAPNCRM